MAQSKDPRQRISLPEPLLQLIDRDVLPKFGDRRTGVLEYIVVAWLSEKGYFDRRGP